MRRDNMTDLTVGMVFLGGIASFISPCFLPLIPIYIGYISGEAVGEGKSKGALKNTIGFILGFTTIFVLLGATASSIGYFLLQYRNLLNRILGLLIIIMGIFYTGLINPSFLNMERRFTWKGRRGSFWGSILLGAAIGFGWTPCIGPILASVLALAASRASVIYGMYLLLIYSMGIAIPFLIASLAIGRAAGFKGILKHSGAIKLVSGIILIITGIMLMTGYLQRLSGYLIG
jgi:cytochrome c-type biogenesis protein